MSPEIQALLQQALRLSEDERVALADGIWQSLGEESQGEMHSRHSMSNPDFRAEIERRSDEARAHPEQLLTWDEVKKQLESRRHVKTP